MKNKKRKGVAAFPSRPIRCPYCGSPVLLRSADGIYQSNNRNTKLYVCASYPRCDAYVRVHSGTNIPVGSMANGNLRFLRRKAHQNFDKLYMTGLMSKQDAYNWLAGILQAPRSQAHIGYLGEYYCQLVIDESRKLLENRQRYTHTRTRRPYLVSGGDISAVD